MRTPFLLGLLLLVLAAPALASTAYGDFYGNGHATFANETAEIGSSPTNNGWAQWSGSAGDWDFNNTWFMNGTKSIRHVSGTTRIIYKNLTANATTDTYNITMYVNMTGVTGDYFFMFTNTTANTCNQFGHRTSHGATWEYYPGTAWTDTGVAITSNALYKMTWQYTKSTLAYNWYINDVSVASGTMGTCGSGITISDNQKGYVLLWAASAAPTGYVEDLNVWSGPYTAPAIIGNTVTNTLYNNVTGSLIGTTYFYNITGTLDFTYFNVTDAGFCVSYSGNGTGTNCTTSGSGSSTYFNRTKTAFISTDTTVRAGTYQALLDVTALQRYTNATILSFNATNNVTSNTTSTGNLTLLANNGSANIQVLVAGNYTQNVTCTVSAPLTYVPCAATGFYDNKFTIGVTNASSGNGITTFTSWVNSTNLNISMLELNTTTGNATFPLLQGYSYLFFVNASGLEYANHTGAANASTNLYNFSLRTANTFNFTILNESTNGLITENVSLNFITGSLGYNYTFTGGYLNISLLTPGDYHITYYVDPDIPRNYYTTLTSGSYNDIYLYIIDAAISNFYTATILNEQQVPQSNVTISLLRDYILANNTVVSRVVEMARTDTNGQAVFRVVPNIVPYRLLITDGTNTLLTTSTQFTASSNVYTLNTGGNPVQSLTSYPSIARSLTYNNATKVFTMVWTDGSNLITRGCLQVRKTTNGAMSIVSDTCSAGSTGTITYTITDTNNTKYQAVGTLGTTSEFSTLLVDTIDVDFSSTFATFGLIGFLIAFLIFLTFAFAGGETGIPGLLVSGVLSMLFLGAFGIIAQSWTVIVGVIIIIGVILYKLRGSG